MDRKRKIKKIFKKIGKFFLSVFLSFVVLVLPCHWLWKVLIVVGYIFLSVLFNAEAYFKKKNNCISQFFGPPGSGKTTILAWIAQLRHQQGEIVLSNVDIENTYKIEPKADLGSKTTYFNGKGCSVILDEATLDYDGRGFKSFSAENRNYFSLFRHDCNEVFIASQAVDYDKRIRDRAVKSYHLQQFFTPRLIRIRKIKKILIIEENNKQLIDGFEFVPFSTRLLWTPPVWPYFDTLDRELCCKEQKTWKPWRNGTLPDIPPFSEEEIKRVEEEYQKKKEEKRNKILKKKKKKKEDKDKEE